MLEMTLFSAALSTWMLLVQPLQLRGRYQGTVFLDSAVPGG